MSKHTPGPWSLDLENIGADIKNHVTVDAPSHGSLANVVWVMDDDVLEDKNSPECEANARLITAAPDLLAALKVLQIWCGLDEKSDTWINSGARAAIAKAEGGAA